MGDLFKFVAANFSWNLSIARNVIIEQRYVIWVGDELVVVGRKIIFVTNFWFWNRFRNVLGGLFLIRNNDSKRNNY